MSEVWRDPARVAEYLSREIPHRDVAEAMLLQAQKCRDVRTYVERAVRQEDGEHVATAVARRLGTDENDPRIEFLDSFWTALVNHTSGAHHIDSRDRLEAATAHAALLVTATMVQHVAELVGPV